MVAPGGPSFLALTSAVAEPPVVVAVESGIVTSPEKKKVVDVSSGIVGIGVPPSSDGSSGWAGPAAGGGFGAPVPPPVVVGVVVPGLAVVVVVGRVVDGPVVTAGVVVVVVGIDVVVVGSSCANAETPRVRARNASAPTTIDKRRRTASS